MIPFKYGTQEQYDAQVKDNSALYFISDTKRIYRGEELIAGVQAMIVNRLPSFDAAIDGFVYVLIEDNTAKLYTKGDDNIIPVAGEILDGSIDSINAFSSEMILTSADDIENADDDKLLTAGAVKVAIDNATGTWEYLDGIENSSKNYG